MTPPTRAESPALPWRCLRCGASFATAADARRHWRRQHRTGQAAGKTGYRRSAPRSRSAWSAAGAPDLLSSARPAVDYGAVLRRGRRPLGAPKLVEYQYRLARLPQRFWAIWLRRAAVVPLPCQEGAGIALLGGRSRHVRATAGGAR